MTTENRIYLPSRKQLIESAAPLRLINNQGNLSAVQRMLHNHDERGGELCRKPLVVLPGTGRKTFPLPSLEQLIAACVQYINQIAAQKRAEEEAKAKSAALQGRQGNGGSAGAIREILEGGSMPAFHTFVQMAPIPSANPHGGTLYLAAGGMSEAMHDGRFEEHLAPIFDPPQGVEDWAANNLPEKFQETVESLRLHWREIYKLFVGDDTLSKAHVAGALPSVMHAVHANFPQASEDEVITAAVTVICKALGKIMNVLSMWDSSFMQQRDGKYSELMYVTYTLEQCFKLMTDGAKVNTLVMKVGDVYMPRYSGAGPATIPGARGPLHAHLIEVPFIMRSSLISNMLVFTHEFRHDVYADVPNLPVEMAQAVVAGIEARAASYKFSKETVSLGGQEAPMLDTLTQIYVQTLSETDADIAGGVLLSGPSFLYSLITVFSALNTMGKSVLDTDVLLRSSSRYGVEVENGQAQLSFEPHMPDYPRAYVVAAALDVLGFNKEAEDCRRLADQAAGDVKPTMVTWRNGDRSDARFKFKIEVPFEDLIQLAPAVADAIINTKLPCLGNRSMRDLVYFDQKKQEKVNKLAGYLIEGKSDFPADFGDVFATYVAAAAVTAYWSLCKGGMRPRRALAQVEACSRRMLDEVQKREANPKTPPAPPSNPSDKPQAPKSENGGSDKN